MRGKTLLKTLLFPPLVVAILLVPIAGACLVCAMVFLETDSVAAILSYVLAAYTLTIWCCKIPHLVRLLGTFRDTNPYITIWRTDTRLRMTVSLYGSLMWNTAYAVFQLALGIRHRTFWFCSLAGYYTALAVMRFFLARHTSRHKPGEKMREELLKYRACGIVFLVMNLALTLILFFMVYWNRTFHHHEITTIALAAYTFTAFVTAIINIVKYRRYNSPVYTASKAISLAAACVSMLTLESTMLTTFGETTMDLASRRVMLGVSGGVVCAFIIVMAVYMIVQSSQTLKTLQQ